MSGQAGHISTTTSNITPVKTEAVVKAESGSSASNHAQRNAPMMRPNGTSTPLNRHATMAQQSNSSLRSSGLGLTAPMQHPTDAKGLNTTSNSSNTSMNFPPRPGLGAGQPGTSASTHTAKSGAAQMPNGHNSAPVNNGSFNRSSTVVPTSAPQMQPQERAQSSSANVPQQNSHPMKNKPIQLSKPAQQPHHANTGESLQESFSLNSDDDAFLARIDLDQGEVDLGRPIAEDEGIGGAIYFDDDLGGWEGDMDDEMNINSNSGQRQDFIGNNGFQSRPNVNTNSTSIQNAQGPPFHSANNHVRFVPGEVKRANSAAMPTTTLATYVNSTSNTNQPPPSKSILPNFNQNITQGQTTNVFNNKPKENQPVRPSAPPPQNLQTKSTTRAPSMGAFHFPPDMVCRFLLR